MAVGDVFVCVPLALFYSACLAAVSSVSGSETDSAMGFASSASDPEMEDDAVAFVGGEPVSVCCSSRWQQQ
jgi:hypothetical protein